MSFFAELKRRNVLRVAAAYVVAAWLVIQAVETIFPAFGFSDSAIRIVVIVLGIGLVPVLIIAWAFEQTGQNAAAIASAERAIAISGNPIYLASLGHSHAKADDDEQARQVLGMLKQASSTQHVSAYHTAVIYAALGDMDESFGWLERAYAERSPWIGYMRMDPRLDPLRSHSGFDLL